MNQIGKKRIISIVLLISMIMSLCSCTNLLQQIFSDYITIDLENGKLLSESDNNEQICTYRIDATITNNYSNELKKAKVILNAPTNVDVTKEGEKATIEGVNLSVGESVDYSWVVRIPMTFEDQNIEYSVTVDSDDVKPITAYASVFVKGKNANDNRMDFSTDTWAFGNFSSKPVCLSQDDYNALLAGLSNTLVAEFNETIKSGAGGYCYGFAASSILVKMSSLDVKDIDSSKSALHDVKKNDESKSVLAYYWLTQNFEAVLAERADFNKKSITERIAIIEEKAKAVQTGGTPFILSFYTQPDGKGGHAVVAYSHENGEFNKGGKMFDSRILIYDSNYPKIDENSYLYYNSGTSDWYIPNYPDSSDITRALSDINIMNVKNIEDNRKSAYSYLEVNGSDDFSISSQDGTLIATVSGVNITGEKSEITVARQDGNDEILIVSIPQGESEEGFTIRSNDNKSLKANITYDNYFMSACSSSSSPISFSPNGSVSINNTTSDFELQITSNSGYYSTDWFNLQLKGESGQNPQISVCEDGYMVSGSDLKGLQIYADNGKTAEELKIKSLDTTILLTQVDSNLCAKTDNDSDGTFETILVVGQKTEVQNPLNTSSPFHWWIIAIIIGAIAVVTGIVIVIKKLFDSKPSKNKKSRKKNNNDDEWWNQ